MFFMATVNILNILAVPDLIRSTHPKCLLCKRPFSIFSDTGKNDDRPPQLCQEEGSVLTKATQRHCSCVSFGGPGRYSLCWSVRPLLVHNLRVYYLMTYWEGCPVLFLIWHSLPRPYLFTGARYPQPSMPCIKMLVTLTPSPTHSFHPRGSWGISPGNHMLFQVLLESRVPCLWVALVSNY